jgi:hypothetical protein
MMRPVAFPSPRSETVAEPSIKGSIFKGAITDLLRLLDEGGVTEYALEVELGAETFSYLEREIFDASWYPMASYDQILQLLGELEGGGKEEYFIARGRASARRLMEAGLYGQLDFVTRWKESLLEDDRDESAAIARYASSLKLVVSLASNIYNVGRWSVEVDRGNPGRVWIAIREAKAYTDAMRLAIEGFVNECGSKHTRTTQLYTSTRMTPDLIVFRMNYDIVEILASV